MPLNLTNSTVSGNTAGRNGGGIYASGTASDIVTIVSSTIVNNRAVIDGGGLVRASTTNPVNLRNTIIANNTDDGTAPDVSGSVVSQGYNLIENTTGAAISGTTTGNLTGVDPNLGPLQDNGGPTQTHALLSGSPAIDKGESSGSTVDQRGLTRPVDHPSIPNATGGNGADIGAFEVQQLSAAIYNVNENGATITVARTEGRSFLLMRYLGVFELQKAPKARDVKAWANGPGGLAQKRSI
jgi:predicted outer membrane repeat protein